MQNKNQYNRSRFRLGFLFAAPAIIILFLVLAYPILASFVLSFQRVRFKGQGITTEWYGLNNYFELLGNQLFRQALFRSVYFTVLEGIAVVILALLVALLTARISTRCRSTRC